MDEDISARVAFGARPNPGPLKPRAPRKSWENPGALPKMLPKPRAPPENPRKNPGPPKPRAPRNSSKNPGPLPGGPGFLPGPCNPDSRPNFGACVRLSVSGEVPVLRMARRVRVCNLDSRNPRKNARNLCFSTSFPPKIQPRPLISKIHVPTLEPVRG